APDRVHVAAPGADIAPLAPGTGRGAPRGGGAALTPRQGHPPPGGARGAGRPPPALLRQAEDNPRDLLAGGVPYLTQWGLLAGGWMHARILAAALAQPESADRQRRILDADFYGVHSLSRIPSLTDVIQAGEIV
ncbi:acyl-CoA dehydrogenase C-terminal domain-containing protein, partial [Streptomyces diastatochromogenes]|uniref:acyl-CoA dehydrogenase C-terminal domain-containing protein n=1 Tax=Streptomyces diastatochromogenes TaxID=42236 RepID=UPI0036AAC891